MFHATLIIMSRKYFYRFSKFATMNYTTLNPSIYDFGLKVSPWKCNLRRQASPLQLELGSGSFAFKFKGTYREWLGTKISKSKILKIFPSNSFSLCFMILWWLWAENIFRFFLETSFSDRKFSKSKYFKSFSGNYSCSCFMLPWSLWAENIFFDFRSSQLPFDIRFWTRGFPLKMQSQKACLPFATRARKRELSIQEVRRYVSRMTWIENFISQNFSKFFWKPLFSTIHATLFIISRNFFFKIGKNENLITKSTKIVQLVLRKLVKNENFDYVINDQTPPPPPRNQP